MKTNILTAILLSLLFIFPQCKDDEVVPRIGPDIQIDESNLSFEGLNVGDNISIPVKVESEFGVKRLSYFFTIENANGEETTDAVHFDDDSTPAVLEKNLEFQVIPRIIEIVVVAFDSRNFSSEVHIPVAEIRNLPVLAFTDNVNGRETVFENKTLSVTGTVTSEHEISALTYAPIMNGSTGTAENISFTPGSEIAFEAQVEVEKGLEGIIFTATNIYDGMVIDTFSIGEVVDDAVSISLQNGDEIDVLYGGKENVLNGTIASGSNVVSFTYAIRQNDAYGEEISIPVGEPADEFNFSISVEGTPDIQAIRFTGTNENSNIMELEVPVLEVSMPLVYLQDVELTTEIGAGKPNWFAAYLEPHVFDQATARANQEMMDFVFTVHGSALRILSAAVYEAASYLPTVAPYMEGFTQATYSVVTSNRGSITSESFAELEFDDDLRNFVTNKIIAPASEGGENYNVAGTNRRTSGDITSNTGLIVGWGSYVDGTAANKAFAIIYVKEASIEDGIGYVKFDIKYPQADYRTMYNPESILTYP